MKQISLEEYVELHGQTETARRAGLTQGGIWQMLQAGRRIFVKERADGTDLIDLEEVKPIRRSVTA
jgi:hypothetical protein